jgi:hypothetical protein
LIRFSLIYSTQYLESGINMDAIGEACSTHVDKKFAYIFVINSAGKGSHEKPKRRQNYI